MKKILLILAAALMAASASAQRHEKNIMGVRAGLNVASYTASAGSVSISSNSRAAWHIAFSDQILLSERLPFYLETGMGVSSRGGIFDTMYDDLDSDDVWMTARPLYLQIPVLVNYHFNIKDVVTIQPFAGLYYGLGICGKLKDKYSGMKVNAFSDEGGLKRSDLGVRLGAGVVWNRIYFGLGYDIGCLNVMKEDIGATLRNNCFTLSVGYNF